MTDSTHSHPADASEEFEIADDRRHDFFVLDNEIIDTFLARIGPHAYAVYSTLVRWSYSKPNVRQSLSELERWTGFSRPTVIKAIVTLTSEEVKLVRREHRTDAQGNPACNLYRLLRVPKSSRDSKDSKEKEKEKDNNNSGLETKPAPVSPPAPRPAPPAPPVVSKPAPTASLQPVLLDTEAQIVQRLLEKQGVSIANARRFVAPDPSGSVVPRPADYAGTQWDWLKEQVACLYDRASAGQTVRNPGKLLTDAIVGGWPLPIPYMQRKTQEEAKRARREHQTQTRSAPGIDKATDEATRAAFAVARNKTRPYAQ